MVMGEVGDAQFCAGLFDVSYTIYIHEFTDLISKSENFEQHNTAAFSFGTTAKGYGNECGGGGWIKISAQTTCWVERDREPFQIESPSFFDEEKKVESF